MLATRAWIVLIAFMTHLLGALCVLLTLFDPPVLVLLSSTFYRLKNLSPTVTGEPVLEPSIVVSVSMTLSPKPIAPLRQGT